MFFQLKTALQSKCENQGEVCCRKDSFHNAPITIDVDDSKEEETDYYTYYDDNEDTKESVSNTGKGPVCNVRVRKVEEDELLPRISSVQGGAAEAEFGEWPNMCIVLREYEDYKGDSFDLYQCGASLIAPGIVLTSAHCVTYVL